MTVIGFNNKRPTRNANISSKCHHENEHLLTPVCWSQIKLKFIQTGVSVDQNSLVHLDKNSSRVSGGQLTGLLVNEFPGV